VLSTAKIKTLNVKIVVDTCRVVCYNLIIINKQLKVYLILTIVFVNYSINVSRSYFDDVLLNFVFTDSPKLIFNWFASKSSAIMASAISSAISSTVAVEFHPEFLWHHITHRPWRPPHRESLQHSMRSRLAAIHSKRRSRLHFHRYQTKFLRLTSA